MFRWLTRRQTLIAGLAAIVIGAIVSASTSQDPAALALVLGGALLSGFAFIRQEKAGEPFVLDFEDSDWIEVPREAGTDYDAFVLPIPFERHQKSHPRASVFAWQADGSLAEVVTDVVVAEQETIYIGVAQATFAGRVRVY